MIEKNYKSSGNPLNFHFGRYFLVILFFFLVNSTIISKPNHEIARSDEPGCFWFRVRSEADTDNRHLYYTSDYGESSDLIYSSENGVTQLEYNIPNGILSLQENSVEGWQFSRDGGYSFENIGYHSASFDWLPECDSLIAVAPVMSFSYDTLHTWIQAGMYGIDGRILGSGRLECIGWNESDYIVMTRFAPGGSDEADSMGVYFSNTYADTFTSTGFSPALSSYGVLYRGISPGELYYKDYYWDSLFASVDTGRTWMSTGSFPLPTGRTPYNSEIEPGWEPGELIWFVNRSDLYSSVEYYIYRSTDYGRTWESMNGAVYNEVVENINITDDFSVSIFPNPANNHTSISFSS
ncbi:MAG: hypothetical protein RAP03_14385, partial [Candidatus Electryonea clarkiae]|nr:hypothetical protein [Candidatus Electryonea clarkiae]